MCTISWEFLGASEGIQNEVRGTNDPIIGYRVYFNRDEQITRPQAELPREFIENNIRYICPIDPQGGGTWCAVNEFGYTFALLNFYQGRLPKGKLRSRGELVKNAALLRSKEAVEEYLSSLDLQKYPPFSLLVFSPSEVKSGLVTLLRWTGKTLEKSEQDSPLISSALYFDDVSASRLQQYHTQISSRTDEPAELKDFIALHKSHEPEKSAYSMCMHRDDAKTVSFSYVEVVGRNITYWYSDGSPCEAPLEKAASLKLKSLV